MKVFNRFSDIERNRKNDNFKVGLEFYPEDGRIVYCDLNYSDYDKSDKEIMQNTDIQLNQTRF